MDELDKMKPKRLEDIACSCPKVFQKIECEFYVGLLRPEQFYSALGGHEQLPVRYDICRYKLCKKK